MILVGLVGARLAYVIFNWSEFSSRLADIPAYWRGGLMFQGGLAGALLASPFFLRRYGLKFWPVADVLAPSLALGQAIGRLGCFSVGCCYGHPATLNQKLAVIFPPVSLAPPGLLLWPTQLMESGGLVFLTLILLIALRSPVLFWRHLGRTAALYLAGAGGLRLVLESFRGDFRGELLFFNWPPTTVAAAATAGVGLFLLAWRRSAGINF
jgi:phosphatidylglycerol:prolipoprotein diacylglycerol transferase